MSLSFITEAEPVSPGLHVSPSRPASPGLSVSPAVSEPAADQTWRPDPVSMNMVIRQDPFSITLDAAALLAVAVLLVVGMHCVSRSVLECLILSVPVAFLVRNDYNNFLKLGPGGTPANFAGYLRLSWYKLFTLRDPFRAPTADGSLMPASGYLLRSSNKGYALPLPYRAGLRPQVAGLAPQRQLTQHGSAACSAALRRTLEALTTRHSERFGMATSSVEKHGLGLFARHPVNVNGNGEVCHIHCTDKSMHLCLHPDDIAEVLAKGWGQRHPMAWTTAWVRSPVPSTFVLIYAPRDENDLRIVCRIIEAAIWYTTAETVDVEGLLNA